MVKMQMLQSPGKPGSFSTARTFRLWDLLPYLLFSLPVVLTAGQPFFWDTLQLASRHAHFFYETGFSSLFLPNDMDSGHIPAFGFYLALIWKVFGKTLVASHLSMLPFVLGAVFFTRKLTGLLFSTKYDWLLSCLLLADAAMLTQFTLVSPDVWILFFFTMALYGHFREKRLLMAVAMAGLTLTSMRGMMLAAGLFFAGWMSVLILRPEKPVSSVKISFGYLLQSLPVYLPGLLIAVTYFSLHYLKTGWIGYHADMPWVVHFERVDTAGFLRNCLVLGWRLADNGRIILWAVLIYLTVKMIHLKIKPGRQAVRLIILTLTILLALSYSSLTYRNLSGHRYLIPVFYLVSLTVLYLLFRVPGIEKKGLIAALIGVCLLSGNCWVYPDRIAKGWDAMLSYLPYQALRKEMILFADQQQIRFSEVGTDFPNNIPVKYIDLNNDTRSFGSIEKGMDGFRYILYSNVFNGFSDAELKSLQTGWKVLKTLHKGQVKMILYENPRE
jgi:hypothetical protein